MKHYARVIVGGETLLYDCIVLCSSCTLPDEKETRLSCRLSADPPARVLPVSA